MTGSQMNEKTPWFLSTIKPVRKGFHESHWLIGSQDREAFCLPYSLRTLLRPLGSHRVVCRPQLSVGCNQ